MKCPCKECICLAVCKHKNYTAMLNECIMINNYLYDNIESFKSKTPRYADWRVDDFDKRIVKAIDSLKPSKWKFVLTDKESNVVAKDADI